MISLLGLGPKYGLPVQKTKQSCFHVISDVEYMFDWIEDDTTKDILRSETTNALENFMNNAYQGNVERQISNKLDELQRFKRNNPDLMILKSDKGNKTVIMEKDEYLSKCLVLLNDTSVYKKISNPTNRISTENNDLVKNLYDNKNIDFVTRSQLITYRAITPKMYFVPKYHKLGVPVRPILSAINGPTYDLSKFATSILNKLVKSEFYVKNSFDFQEYITKQKVPFEHSMVSFDVVSLFTNIPIELVMEALENRWTEIATHTSIPKRKFIKMIKLCIENSYFSFLGVTYLQIFGVPMGSPLSPILAEIVLDMIIKLIIERVKDELNINIMVLKKYVDDLFLILPTGSVDQVLNIFNRQNQYIQFTAEKEENYCIPFLDMLVIRSLTDGEIVTKWYRKPIASGRFLNWESLHPLNQKLSTMFGFIDRMFRLSSLCFHNECRQIVIKSLTANNYPNKIIAESIVKYHRKRMNALTITTIHQKNQQNTEVNRFFSLTYIKGASERTIRAIRRHTENFKIALRNISSLDNEFSKVKDKDPVNEHSEVIYSIPCSQCNDRPYIGITKQLVKSRMSQHKSTINCNQPEKSALARHALERGHNFDFDGVSILAHQSNRTKREFMEELFIKSSKKCVNLKSRDSANVSAIYSRLFDRLNNI